MLGQTIERQNQNGLFRFFIIFIFKEILFNVDELRLGLVKMVGFEVATNENTL